MKLSKAVHISREGRPKVEITISIQEGRLSICGASHALGCGQILKNVAALYGDIPKVAELVAIWERWHLNDMNAGSPKQEDFLRGKHLCYEEALKALGAVGLLQDDGYTYGSAWLFEALPEDVVTFLTSLGETL